ncbi:MAG: 4Fe-4S dicluster domain-containing protein [Verrucomicrobiota bacterium]|jgi:molybdopterin-containing oxidoreductase family iron-sulfur binding subunit
MNPPLATFAEQPLNDRRYWRHVGEPLDFAGGGPGEFPAGADKLDDPASRREFLKLMSASLMLAGVGLAGCRRPEERIEPFGMAPEGRVHGVPEFFATAMPTRSAAIPLLVKSLEGRPVKIEGNALHPLNQWATGAHGGTDRYAQAAILSLYDPDRARRCLHRDETVPRGQALAMLDGVARQAAAAHGRGLAFLLERSSSPSRWRLQQQLADALWQARWFIYESVDFDIHRQAATSAFGRPVRPFWRLEQAQRIVSLDCDFLGTEEESWRLTRGFAAGRGTHSAADGMNRLYAVESLFTLTGANADHRLRVAPSQVMSVARALAAEVLARTGAGTPDLLAALRANVLPPGVNPIWIRECAADLVTNPGRSLVLVGGGQPLALHLLMHAINLALGNFGQTVQLLPVERERESAGSIVELALALTAGAVETLVILGGNPAYDAPVDLDWPAAQRRARTVIRLGDAEDETAALANWHLPRAHFLEAWGDARTADGTLVPVQPLIEPIFDGLTDLEVLARLGGLATTKPYDIVRDTFRGLVTGGTFEADWRRFLHDGFLAGSAAGAMPPVLDWSAVAGSVAANAPAAGPGPEALEVVFHRDHRMDDGRFSNNGWLQELPDPVTKLTWDNVLLLSPRTAYDLGIAAPGTDSIELTAPVVRLTVNGRSVEGPVWIQPGLADFVVGLALGGGRARSGRVGQGSGFNAAALRTTATPGFAAGGHLVLTGRTAPLACTQMHGAMSGSPVIREAELAEYRKHPQFAREADRAVSASAPPLYPNPLDQRQADARHQWGMVVDLNACVGCAACVIACQSENNIPIVGKDQVRRQREMHWLRLDRYYTGSSAEPRSLSQPMLCQHCEAAPCESVCPVNATVHDAEGLNVMVYNRCLGTRYCSNNCPYKVRRFNFLDYHRRPLSQLRGPVYSSPVAGTTEGEWNFTRWLKDRDRGTRPADEWDLLKLATNPDVTVRMRGVMEKCTFCTQRIEQAKIAQKIAAGASGDVTVADGAVQTACQQACPAKAIVFGNLKDPASAVSRASAGDRAYTVLGHLGTRPRVTYLARIRNPNPAIREDVSGIGSPGAPSAVGAGKEAPG